MAFVEPDEMTEDLKESDDEEDPDQVDEDEELEMEVDDEVQDDGPEVELDDEPESESEEEAEDVDDDEGVDPSDPDALDLDGEDRTVTRDPFEADGKLEVDVAIRGWVPPVFAKRISFPRLTKYESCRILAVRVEHLSRGAQPCVPVDGQSWLQVAERELQTRRLPLLIRRQLPNGLLEEFSLAELELIPGAPMQ